MLAFDLAPCSYKFMSGYLKLTLDYHEKNAKISIDLIWT